jgi:hypothetical protein
MLDEGVTAKAVAGIAKRVLVAEAMRRSSMASGRVNHSKVAALTGLTRTDVRTILHSNLATPSRSRTGLDRITRVVEGWQADPRFLSRRGKPRALPLGTTKGTFGDLVRRHSGDIPPRVVLQALIEKHRVIVKNRLVSLLPEKQPNRPTKRATQPPDVTPYIADILSAATSDRVKLTFAHRLELTADTDTLGTHLSDRVARTLSTAIAALGANVAHGGPAGGGVKLVVSVAVTEHHQ